jgi:hypothetical integral membrane protein (TIGR02206 family)
VARLLAPEHLLAVLATLVVAVALTLAVRSRPGPWTERASQILAGLLVLSEAAWWAEALVAGRPWLALPLQLCDAATLVAAAALWWRRRLLVEATYFWALAGTLQALITPDLAGRFPSLDYLQYYSSHALVVVAALYLVAGLRIRPRPRAWLRVLAVSLAFTLLAGLVDATTGANYMYLRRVPASGSLLDLFGPWPWYIGWAVALAVILFGLLQAPFARRPGLSSDAGPSAPPRPGSGPAPGEPDWPAR